MGSARHGSSKSAIFALWGSEALAFPRFSPYYVRSVFPSPRRIAFIFLLFSIGFTPSSPLLGYVLNG